MAINENFLAVRSSLMGHGLKAIDILIAAKVQEFGINGLECYISNESFSKMFGESVSTVRRSIERLIKLNVLTKKHGYISGRSRSNHLRMLKMVPMSEWKIDFDKEDSNDTDNGVLNMNSPKESEPFEENGVFTENSPSSNGVFKSDEWSVHREHLIDKEKKNNIKENNTLADASGVADATYSIPEHTEDITNEQDESSDARMVEKEDNDMSDNNTKKNVPYVDELDFAETLDERDNFEETISFFLGSDVPVYKRKRELHKYLVDTYGVDVKDIEHLVSTLDMFYGSED